MKTSRRERICELFAKKWFLIPHTSLSLSVRTLCNDDFISPGDISLPLSDHFLVRYGPFPRNQINPDSRGILEIHNIVVLRDNREEEDDDVIKDL